MKSKGDRGGGQERQAMQELARMLGVSVIGEGMKEGGFTPRTQLLAQHEMMYQACTSAPYKAHYPMADPRGALSPCEKPVEELRPVTLKQLHAGSLGEVAKGRVLKLRTITKPCQMVAVNTVGEDAEGVCVTVSLYNVVGPKRPSSDRLLKMYPVGTQLLIKDPYLKVSNSGMLAIRLDHPANLVVLSADGEVPRPPPEQEAERLKAEGNQCFAEGAWADAVGLYDKALALKPPAELSVVLRSNKAQALLLLGKYARAREEARQALAIDPGHVKARYRLALAQAGLERHEEALALLQELQREGGVAVAGCMAVVKRRMAESAGDHAFSPRYYHSALSLAHQSAGGGVKLGWARYVGPVEVRSAGERRGRGLFVTADVRKGQVLLVEPALAVNVADDERNVTLSMDLTEKIYDQGGAHDGMVQQLVQQAMEDPLLNARLLSLYDGSDDVKRTVPPASLFQSEDPELCLNQDKRQQHPACSVDRIRRVLRYNAFGRETDGKAGESKPYGRGEVGLWGLCSFMNATTPAKVNVQRCHLSAGVMIVEAAADLPAGTELLTMYSMNAGPDQMRKQWGIEQDMLE